MNSNISLLILISLVACFLISELIKGKNWYFCKTNCLASDMASIFLFQSFSLIAFSIAPMASLGFFGLIQINDFSGKFRGFEPGYTVFVVGPYESRIDADRVRRDPGSRRRRSLRALLRVPRQAGEQGGARPDADHRDAA